MAASFQCFCPAAESTCPKRGRQIGRYASIEAAKEAQVHHLTHSSYHYMEEDRALALVEAKQDLMIVMEVEHTPVPSTAIPSSSSLRPTSPLRSSPIRRPTTLRPPSPHRRRSRSRSPNASIASVIAHLRRSEEAARNAAKAAIAAAKTFEFEADEIKTAIEALEQRG